jgi:hypothetical protein
MTYEPDIIVTIERTGSEYIKRNKKIPECISLSSNEFEAYKQERENGRLPIIKYKGKQVILSVRRFS